MSEDTAFEVGRLYVPIKAIADTLVASQKDIFIRLPGLAGYYPMGIRNASGHVIDHSQAAANLLQTGTCPTGYDGNSFIHLGDGVNYLSGGSNFGITGLETYIDSSIRGLTVGGWFWADVAPSLEVGMITKDKLSPERGWGAFMDTSDTPVFFVSSNGAATFTVTGSPLTIGAWHFIAFRFIPSTEIAVFQDGDKSVNTTAIPVSINVSTQNFEIGRYIADDSRTFHGRERDVFVCAAALSDALIEEIRATSVP